MLAMAKADRSCRAFTLTRHDAASFSVLIGMHKHIKVQLHSL